MSEPAAAEVERAALRPREADGPRRPTGAPGAAPPRRATPSPTTPRGCEGPAGNAAVAQLVAQRQEAPTEEAPFDISEYINDQDAPGLTQSVGDRVRTAME